MPHPEVDLILVNGCSVDFSCRMKDGDTISVYPVFESLDISPIIRLRERPLRDPKFIADAHLGKLTKYLRLCGFDTCFRNDYHDIEIIDLAETEKRTILTRDRELLKNKSVTHGYWIRSQKPREQLEEVIKRLDLKNQVHPFIRCLVCNHPVNKVQKEEVRSFLLPKTMQFYQDFWKCNECGRIYWKGSHYNRMREFVEGINEK